MFYMLAASTDMIYPNYIIPLYLTSCTISELYNKTFKMLYLEDYLESKYIPIKGYILYKILWAHGVILASSLGVHRKRTLGFLRPVRL